MPATKAFAVRYHTSDLAAARAIAREEGLTLSAVLRRAVRRDVRRGGCVVTSRTEFRPRRSEMSDAYPYVVAVLDDDRRVIECAARIQWIIQKRVSRRGYPWEGVSFCRTKEALVRLAGPHPLLMAFPDRYPEPVSRPVAEGRSEFEGEDGRWPATPSTCPPSLLAFNP